VVGCHEKKVGKIKNIKNNPNKETGKEDQNPENSS
jgi:hypothetical protein